jgi:small-conductance mechanosensitive channel
MFSIIEWLYNQDLIQSIVIVLIGVLAAILIDIILKIAESISKKTKDNLDDIVIEHMRRPIFLGVTIGTVFIAAIKSELFLPHMAWIKKAAVLFAILITTYGLIRFVKALFLWYGEKEDRRLKIPIDDRYLKIFRKGINVLILVIGIIIVLDQLNVSITPFITSLGIGGLVIALALQESLGNFFAGFNIITEKSIKIGDFLKLDSGIEGIVDDITWRVTKIKTIESNIILVPNSKLAQSIITNYDNAQKDMDFKIEVGVSYESDLEKVEKITIDAAKKVQETCEGATKGFHPYVRYHTFADSNINFRVTLHINTYDDNRRVTHEFIKVLKKAYDKNKITINYPVRAVYMRKKNS